MSERRSAGPARGAPRPTPGVLVVDDDPDILEYLTDLLTGEGFRVKALSDPTRAVEALRESEYHIAVIDLMMQPISGIELLGQIRKRDRDIAVIILTGHPSVETASASIEHEVSAYMKKPFGVGEFREALDRILRRKGLLLRREDELHQVIGQTIRDLRKSQALTLKELARRTNLSVSLLSQIERAECSASVASLYKIATSLGVHMTELFGDF